jgi:hypothetical protein
MDKEEHLEPKFDDLVGHNVDLHVHGNKLPDGLWDVNVIVGFKLTVNGIDWAEKVVNTSIVEDDYEDAFATAMLTVANIMSTPKFMHELRNQLDGVSANKEVH